MLLADAAHQGPPLDALAIIVGVVVAVVFVFCWMAWRDANSPPDMDI